MSDTATGNELAALVSAAKRMAVENRWDQPTIAINTQIVELDPTNTGAHTRLAKCFDSLGQRDAAAATYREVLQFDPDNRIARNRLADFAREDRAAASGDVRQVAARLANLGTYQEAAAIGRAAKRDKDWVVAAIAWRRAREIAPSDSREWSNSSLALAAAYRHLGQLTKAQKVYEELLRRDNSSAVRTGFAALLCDLGHHEDAWKLLDGVLSEIPDDPFALNAMARTCMLLGRPEEALRLFARALRSSAAGADRPSLIELRAHFETRADLAAAEKVGVLLRSLDGVQE